MRKTGRWFSAVFAKVVVIILVVLLLPFARDLLHLVLPDVTGEIRTQSRIIEQKLESSQRLEITKIEEEGVLEAKTNVIILGTVGSTTIRYRYTASIGIDMKKVIMTADSDRIVFLLPEAEILNDGIEALEVKKNNLFSRAIEKSVEALMNEQRLKCREEYLAGEQHSERIREYAVNAFLDTVCQWLEGTGERHYEFEIRMQSGNAAV